MGILGSVLLLVAVSMLPVQARERSQTGDGPPEDVAVWASLRFLVGSWTGEGTGTPGEGTGNFSFTWDLDQRILVRRNRADYPPTGDRPAFSHRDLTIVYTEAGSKAVKAIYFDNEGHVINYSVSVLPEGNAIQFVSDSIPSVARYRLTYMKNGGNAVKLRFEIAPPGKPDSFTTYIEASARRD